MALVACIAWAAIVVRVKFWCEWRGFIKVSRGSKNWPGWRGSRFWRGGRGSLKI